MVARSRKIVLALAVVVFAGLALLPESRFAAQGADGLSPQEIRGKRIYVKGVGESGEIKALLGSGDLELSGGAFPCANCHGLRGEGTSEGGLQPPPLNWQALTSPQRWAYGGKTRGPYNETTLARAITSGVNADGGRLHPGMPRYKMTAEQMADLIAYLKKLGKELDHDPGVSEQTIKVGAALPMSGPLARIGESVRQALLAYFNEVNREGGIYGRRFEVVIADSRGDAAGTAEATRRLVEQDEVFALVGSFEPAASEAANEFLRQREVPLVGPVTLSPRLPAVPNPYVFYLLPSFADQSRSLVDFISRAVPPPAGRTALRLAVVYAENDLDEDALFGLKGAAQLYSMPIVAEHRYQMGKLSPAAAVKSLSEQKPDCVFFFGSGDEFVAVAGAMERMHLQARLCSSAVMLGRAAFNLPPGLVASTYLSYPASLPDRDNFAEFIALMRGAGVELKNTAFQAAAYAAAKVFVEAVKSSNRQLSRAVLVRALEQLRDYQTGVTPPVTFGPNRRIGASGSYIVKIALDQKQYVPVGDRVVPKAVRP
ncbi:MAG TPA: ABC transporter substrate-binding protein [Blastocatellia bacterium]|nr:ABC transporter substrate-binding protein [Blastocatellia bacterium]